MMLGMSRPVDGELNDENVHLIQKALYVEPLHYPLDLNKFPTNGHEYIHQVRHEEASYFPEMNQESRESFTMCFPEIAVLPKNISLSHWKRREANSFSHMALELKLRKPQLMQRFSQKEFPPIDNEKAWCLFSLGSDLYKKIFDEDIEEVKSNPPYLSIVLYLNQGNILVLLKYMENWLNVIGMQHDLCRWIYSLLACLLKPLEDNCEEFLEKLYDSLSKKSKICDKSEKNQFNLITAILTNYFCIKAYKVGPSLEKFTKLC